MWYNKINMEVLKTTPEQRADRARTRSALFERAAALLAAEEGCDPSEITPKEIADAYIAGGFAQWPVDLAVQFGAAIDNAA